MNTYIPPTGTIQMMVGVHLNPKQEDTLYFDSAGIRDEFFNSYIYATYDEQSYSRPTRDSVKIQDTADRLYKCQYMRFKNGAAFGGQWIYAFVLAVEYINNNTCQVFYAIDDMITWFPQCTLRECFVEREIPETDNLYENLVPENLETGEYTSVAQESFDLNETSLVIYTSKVYNSQTGDYEYPKYANDNYKYGEVNDIFCPLAIIRGNVSDTTDMQLMYDTIMGFVDDGHSDDIVNIQFMPKFITDNIKYAESPGSGIHYNTDEVTVLQVTSLGELGNRYTPKNKKLLTYPYCVLTVSNQQGQIKEYHWEDFTSQEMIGGTPRVKFKVWGTFYSNPCVTVTPEGYKNLLGSGYDYAVTLTNFPPAPWICDTFKAYLAQNKASIATSILGDIIGGALGISTHVNSAIGQQAINNNVPNINPIGQIGSEMSRNSAILGGIGAAIGIGTNIAGTLAEISDKKAMPNRVANLSQTDAFNLITKNTEITFTQMTIKREMARVIDNYFSMFGYAQHKVKIPNTHSRPIWNYTKTLGCVVIGDVPASALQNISAIFDRGIRFWKEMAEIGNYEHDNSPR